MIESLRRGQAPQRGYLGVSLQPLDENIAASLGLPKDQGELVRSTVPGQSAAKAGIQQGDVILRVGGTAGESRPDGELSDRQYDGRLARPARGHSRRPPPDDRGDRRPAPERG